MTTGSHATRGSGRWRLPARVASSLELALHLSGRQLRSTHRRTLFGWSWPLVLQLAQLGVLVFVFQKVIELPIPDYPTFVFSGLVFWSFFQSGVLAAVGSVTDNQALVLEPRMPTMVLPMIALVVAAFDLAVALPVLVLLLVLTTGLELAALALPLILGVQLLLMVALGLLLSALHVRFRDTRPLAGVVLLITFYLSPIFYSLENVPDRFGWVTALNPLSTIIDGYHEVLLDGSLPPAGPLIAIALIAGLALAVAVTVFRHLRPSFADDL